jgi:hypothetical protein
MEVIMHSLLFSYISEKEALLSADETKNKSSLSPQLLAKACTNSPRQAGHQLFSPSSAPFAKTLFHARVAERSEVSAPTPRVGRLGRQGLITPVLTHLWGPTEREESSNYQRLPSDRPIRLENHSKTTTLSLHLSSRTQQRSFAQGERKTGSAVSPKK